MWWSSGPICGAVTCKRACRVIFERPLVFAPWVLSVRAGPRCGVCATICHPKTMTDDELLNAWESLVLPLDQWDHRAHVRVAFTYLGCHPFPEALVKMRAGIKAFNGRHQIPETPTIGYNETTTYALMHLIAATMQAYGQVRPTPDGNSFCDTHPQLMTPYALRLFYTPERRMDPLAKTQFVEPDLAPLPRILHPGQAC